MSRISFYLKERIQEIKKRASLERYKAQKLPKWERIVFTWVILFIFWIIVSANFGWQNLVLGSVIALIISSFMYDMLTDDIRYTGNILQKLFYIIFFYLPQYVLIMAFNLLESNFKVIKNVIFMDINPGVIKIDTDLNSDTGITILANSITLTPGTLTLDVKESLNESYLYVHWIDVKTMERKRAGDKIKGDVEEWLKKIFW